MRPRPRDAKEEVEKKYYGKNGIDGTDENEEEIFRLFRFFRNPFLILICASAIILQSPAFAQAVPDADRRMTEIRHLDLTYSFPEYKTKEAWLARADYLRKQILTSAGLWPRPAAAPIKAEIFGRVDRGDHTVEKVYFESYPGHYVTGNLYRPKNRTGRLPAVLCPHGHWTYGRLENSPLNSGPARAASFARQGYVAFSYDMVGYNDSSAISHKFAIGHREGVDREMLWGVNLLGLQLWNSIRSVDFLLTLPEVDPDRVACTGESGGGTQTFLLMAVDERIKTAAPVNMVSFLMQGGSLCENAPNLRIDANNVELASLMAPRPMFIVSATGDWTKNTLTSEFPAVKSVYKLFGAEDKVQVIQVDAPHNYNQESREAVYGWFAHWLLGRAETSPIKERGGAVATIPELLVFFNRQRPANEFNESQLSDSLIRTAKDQLEQAFPDNPAGLKRYRENFETPFRYSIMAEYPQAADILVKRLEPRKNSDHTVEPLTLSRHGRGDRVELTVWKPVKPSDAYVIVAEPQSDSLIQDLVKSGRTVISVNCFKGGREVPQNIKFFATYNRTDQALIVQDIVTAIAFVEQSMMTGGGRPTLSLIAQGKAGLPALLARGLVPKLDLAVIDAAQFDSSSDEEFLKHMPIPGIRRAGDFTTSVAIAPLSSLLIHNTGDKFRTDKISTLYRNLGRAGDFKSESKSLSNAELLRSLSSK